MQESTMYRKDTSGCGKNSYTIIQNIFNVQYILVAVMVDTGNTANTSCLLSRTEVCASNDNRISCGLSNERCGICGMLWWKTLAI